LSGTRKKKKKKTTMDSPPPADPPVGDRQAVPAAADPGPPGPVADAAQEGAAAPPPPAADANASADAPPPKNSVLAAALAFRARLRSALEAAGLGWVAPADVAALLAGSAAGAALTLLWQPLLGAWVFAEGVWWCWQSYRCVKGRAFFCVCRLKAVHTGLNRARECGIGAGGRRGKGKERN
jgi:hypothetical protein